MLRALIEFCIHRRKAVMVVAAVVAAVGVSSYLSTAIEAFPDVTNLQVDVIAQKEGLAPEEVEKQLTIPLERALNGLPGVISTRSESLFGLSLVILTFDDGADVFKSRSLVSERAATADMPEGVVPELSPDDTPLGEIYQYSLVSDRASLDEVRAWQESTVTRMFRQIDGVADVVSSGGFLKEYRVAVDPERLLAHGLTLADVSTAIEHSNQNVGGGVLVQGDQQLLVRSVGVLTSPHDLESVVLQSRKGTPVTVGEVATVLKSHTPRAEYGSVGQDAGKDVVEGFVLLRRGENPSEVLDRVHAMVAQLDDHVLPKGMRIVPFYDRTDLVDLTLGTVHENLLHGAILIFGVVWLFLRSFRGAIVVSMVIPLSLLGAFIGLHALGLPANLISMGAIDFGILVDGAVILVENVIHHVREERPSTKKQMLHLIARSAVDVAPPTFYSMAIILAAMIPVFSLQRVEGRIFRPLAMTYSFALLGALLCAMTVVPALCALLLRAKDAEAGDPAFIVWTRERYRRTLSWALSRRVWIAGAAVALLVTGGFVATRLGAEFLPSLDEGDLVIFVEMPPSISLEKGQDVLADVRHRLQAFPEVLTTLSEQGRPEDGTDDEQVNQSETFVRLKPAADWPAGTSEDVLLGQMRASLEQIPGVDFNFSQPIKDNVEEAISGVRGEVVLKIFGEDLDAMHDTLESAKSALAKVPGVVDLDLYKESVQPQVRIDLDRSALARDGIAIADAQDTVQTALAGKVATSLWEGEREIPVRVALPSTAKQDMESIGDVAVPTSTGGWVPLRDVSDVHLATGRPQINRESNSRVLALKFNVEGRDLGSVIRDAMAAVDAHVKKPDGTFMTWGGEFENQQRAMQRLETVVPLSLIVVLFLLYSSLARARTAGIVLAIVPFALTGGVFALWISGINLSVSAAIGFIALLGQVSLAGLLVLSAVEARRIAGEELLPAVIAGASERFRALWMATLLAMVGLTPMALSHGVGSETQKPFSVVLIGGMATTFVVALFLLPVLYTWLGPATMLTPEEEDEQ